MIETERLKLAPLKEANAKQLFDLLQDTALYTYIPQDPPASLEELRKRYVQLEKGCSDPRTLWLNWVAR